MDSSNKSNGIIIDYLRILRVLWKKKFQIAAVAVLCAVVLVLGSAVFISPKYQADILVYVNNHTISVGGTSISFNSGELTAARQLLDTYIVALESRTTLDTVIKKADLPYTRNQLSKMISAGPVNNTEWFTVEVVTGDPEESRIIANTIAEVLPDVLSSTIEGSSVKILDYAVKPKGKVNPGYVSYAEWGFIAGLAVMIFIIVIKEIMNDKIHGEYTLEEISENIPVLATIPNKGIKGYYSKKYKYGYSKKGYGYGYASQKGKKTGADMPVCGDLDFAQIEAYNLLQTSVQYSFSHNNTGKVIGITGSERNEGKSTLAINLAYSLSLDKKKVLLLEGDMRLPSIAKKLGIESAPGLSDYLTGRIQNNEGVQLSEKAPSMSVICSGIIPPNPFRLLGSESMESLINALKEVYDYIIVDLPPVTIVSDALSIAKYLDGFIVATRTEYSTRHDVLDAIKKLQAVNTSILGFVVNEDGAYSRRKYSKYSKYGKYGKYGKYEKYSSYSKSYEGGYGSAAEKKSMKKS